MSFLLKSLKILIEYTNDIGNIYKNIAKYNPNKNCKIVIVFDDIIPDMLSNKKINPILTELFIRGRKQNISDLLQNLTFLFQKKILS